MIIRKLFKFENAHVVRGCSTLRCRSSIHGHSYKVELLFESNFLDNAQMVYDFGLMKQNMKAIIDSFDHSITLWDKDEAEYIASMQKHSQRWVLLPLSPSAEQFSRLFFVLIDKLLSLTTSVNGEKEVKLYSVIVHETDTGYAQAFKEDAYSKNMGIVNIDEIIFSDTIKDDWADRDFWDKMKKDKRFLNPTTV
ncbi:6-pyruvoyl tetrahydrobiopterin synthase-like protein [Sulfurimonas denitrificans DSM 1251]|uniref:6-carboxy-5,6,7,8-tetrahydropterin synthase n=1 Tax=Sulfurimonas denitrificans (strain ATCC 33889 / DSM 1251) TaxID=326298 RepID=Q30P94_SULDN|nr:6-carboxytetrahydropterin synthase [Sulfurimonas denitrificans]ABB45187.1 6-pyruvoyl tetrahydrobiopterin synthase-like protein [Sulfurimonas denitrificans DSM 1251]MDD3443514.1 6-carboxytetrahydropterin synthase [Sulfurimonas denitrificans]